jgi:1-phosphatidylinositol-3-phosphate 5-kinase
VQLDDNFHSYIQQSPLYLSEQTKRVLSVCIFNDTVFLTKVNVMDYSLLVGIDEDNSTLVALSLGPKHQP